MKNYNVFIALTLSIVMSSCAIGPNAYAPQAPSVDNFAASYQKQLNASSHWSIIAEDLANQLKINLDKNRLNSYPIHLHLHSENTDFTDAFDSFFTTHLVKKGIKVSKSPEKSLIYNYKIQPISFKSFRSTTQTNKYRWTTLGAGILVLRNIMDSWNVKYRTEILGLAAGAGVEHIILDHAPKLELIIDSSILSNDIYLYKTTDVYYANNTDIHLYKKQSVSDRSSVFDDPFYQ